MNPFLIIADMHIKNEQKIDLLLVLVGFKKMARIDLYEGDDSLLLIKTALLKMGILSHDMPTSGTPGHLFGFVVTKDKDCLAQFKEALIQKDTEILKKLFVPLEFPLTEEMVKITQIQRKIPTLYRELSEAKKIAIKVA